MRFAFKQYRNLVEKIFSQTLCLHVGCLVVLSPTEFVQMGVSLLTILGVLHCNPGFSPAFTLIFPCSSMKIDSLAMFNVLEISLLFAIDFETFGKLSFWTNRNSICSAWWISSALRGPFCFVLNLIQLAMNFLIRLKVVYLEHSNSWSSLVSAAKGLVTCSVSTSFIWHHGFGHFSASDWSHASPFIYTDSAVMPSMDIPWVPMSAGFLTPFTCLHGSIDEFFSVSAVLFATNICCL